MKAALVALALILLAISGMVDGNTIQESSGISYFAYAINVSGNHTTIWTDATTIQFLDAQENTTFVGVD